MIINLIRKYILRRNVVKTNAVSKNVVITTVVLKTLWKEEMLLECILSTQILLNSPSRTNATSANILKLTLIEQMA